MNKTKLLLVSLLAVIMTAACALFAACGTKYNIEWNVDEHATVTVEGYSELPKAVKEGEIVFTVTPADGYEVDTVLNGKNKVNAKDGKYTVRVNSDVSLTVSVRKSVESITATFKDNSKVYYVGDTVESADVDVSVKYKLGDTETITSGYTIKYTTGAALSIGDSDITVTYRGIETKATLPLLEGEEGVVGKITLNLNGGKLTDADVEAFGTKPHFTNADGKVSWTFSTVSSDAIDLPSPVLPVGEIVFPFLKWTGTVITDNKVPANTAESVEATASYETTIVELDSIELATQDGVPYLVMKGEFKAATEAYLFLYEGNKPETFLNGDTVTKSPDSDEFVLNYDLKKFASEAGLVGKWMDIKLCTKIGEQVVTQEINLNDYASDFIVGRESARYIDAEVLYLFSYEKYTPQAGDKNQADGSFYDGTENLLKLKYTKTEGVEFYLDTAKIENREGKPYLVLPGACVSIKDKAAAETALTGYIKDLQNFDGWVTQDITQTVKVNEDLTFEILIGLENVTTNGNYIMHVSEGKSNPTSNDSNFNPSDYDSTPVTVGNFTYKLVKHNTGWGWQWFAVNVVNNDVMKLTGVKLEAGKIGNDDVAFLVFNGTLSEALKGQGTITNADALKELFTEYSVQTDDGWAYLNGASDADKKAENTVFVMNADGTFEVKIALNGAGNDSYWYLHLCHTDKSNGDVNREHVTIDETTVTVGGQTFSFFDSTNAAPEGHQSWLQGRLVVYVAAAK